MIGKKGLAYNSSITDKLIENCETENETLTVTFREGQLPAAIPVTYHAPIPKLRDGQELNVEVVIN